MDDKILKFLVVQQGWRRFVIHKDEIKFRPYDIIFQLARICNPCRKSFAFYLTLASADLPARLQAGNPHAVKLLSIKRPDCKSERAG